MVGAGEEASLVVGRRWRGRGLLGWFSNLKCFPLTMLRCCVLSFPFSTIAFPFGCLLVFGICRDQKQFVCWLLT